MEKDEIEKLGGKILELDSRIENNPNVIYYDQNGQLRVFCLQSTNAVNRKCGFTIISNDLPNIDDFASVRSHIKGASYIFYDEKMVYNKKDNYIVHAAIKEAESVFQDIKKYDDELNLAKSSMNIWSGPYMDSFSKNEYNDAKEKYDKINEKLTEAKEEAKEKVTVLLTLLNAKPELLGHKYVHNYRANNNAGNTLIGNMVFFIDDKYEKVLYGDDLENYSKYQKLITGLLRKIKPKVQYSDEEIEEALDYLVENTKPSFPFL